MNKEIQEISILKISIVLIMMIVISGFIIATLWQVSVNKTDRKLTYKIDQAIMNFSPTIKRYEIKKIQNETIYFCYNDKDDLVSKAFLAQAKGSLGSIKILMLLQPDLNQIMDIQILEKTGSINQINTENYSQINTLNGQKKVSVTVADLIHRRIILLKEMEE